MAGTGVSCANLLTTISEQHINRVYKNNRMVGLVAELRTGFPSDNVFWTVKIQELYCSIRSW